jgi:2,5-diamino-6-(ribosylamino)-4(3H)-pyrimidinone 5'-phosphate reductase
MSVDGKITSGKSNELDSDKDWKRIAGVKEGFYQYYQHEMEIAKNSLNTGRVMEKIGINERVNDPAKNNDLSFFIVDRKPHLDNSGVRYLAKWVNRLFIVTNNLNHPGYAEKETLSNIEMIYYEEDIDFQDLLFRIKDSYGIEKLTIQSGGTLNTILVRKGLIDHLCIYVVPLLVGGSDTSSLLDGISITTEAELFNLKALVLTKCEALKDSYIRLEYDVIKETTIG